MKKYLLFVLIFLFSFSSFLFSQDDYPDNYDDDKTAEMVERIYQALEKLDQRYLTKLRYRDYVDAKELLYDIYSYLQQIPLEEPVVVSEPVAIGNTEFTELLTAIDKESFQDDKLSVIQLSANYNYFLVEQVIEILDKMTYSTGKTKALEIIYPNVIDVENSHLIINHFTYSSDKEKAKQIINNN